MCTLPGLTDNLRHLDDFRRTGCGDFRHPLSSVVASVFCAIMAGCYYARTIVDFIEDNTLLQTILSLAWCIQFCAVLVRSQNLPGKIRIPLRLDQQRTEGPGNSIHQHNTVRCRRGKRIFHGQNCSQFNDYRCAVWNTHPNHGRIYRVFIEKHLLP